MSQTSHEGHGEAEDESVTELDVQPAQQDQEQEQDAEFDSLLDEIDGVLETNAEEFVRSFVQKGGQ